MPTQPNLKIIAELAEVENSYDEPIEIIEGLQFSQKQQIKTTLFYTNSKYLNGNIDELGREKPFDQIINGMCDVEDAAKDMDTKDTTVESETFGSGYGRSFVASKELQDWMDEYHWGQKLNKIKQTHTKWGSVLVKKVTAEDEDGESYVDVELPEWKNVKTDQIDIINGTIIETHYMLPSKLWEKKDVWHDVGEALKLREKAPGTKKEGSSTSQRVVVKEVRGYFPLSYYKEVVGETVEKEDEEEFTYQLYYIAGDKGKQIVLYEENDTEKVYKYLARKPKDGRAFGVGVPEELEQAQVWTNDVVQKQHRALELTSKAIGQTASKKLKGRNLLNETDNGTILEHEEGKPITMVQLMPSGGMTQFDNLRAQWFQRAEQISSKYDAQRGEQPASGTPFRLQALALNQSNSVHIDLKEELELFVGEILTDWILPDLMKRITKAHILEHEFTPEELKEIDRNFATYRANEEVKKKILAGEIVEEGEYDQLFEAFKEGLGTTKNKRFLDIPDGYFTDFEGKVKIYTSNEQRNKAAVLESLYNIMTLYVQNPNLVQDPVLSKIFMQMIEISGAGISPVSLMGAIAEQAKMLQEKQVLATQTTQQPNQTNPKKLSLDANPLAQVNA